LAEAAAFDEHLDVICLPAIMTWPVRLSQANKPK